MGGAATRGSSPSRRMCARGSYDACIAAVREAGWTIALTPVRTASGLR